MGKSCAVHAWPVFVDSHQLENAIVNLAVNARDAMDGEGTLTISSDNVTLTANAVGDIQPGEYLRISVSDIGSGRSAVGGWAASPEHAGASADRPPERSAL